MKRITLDVVVIFAALVVSACSGNPLSASKVDPSPPPPAVREVSYDINIPSLTEVRSLVFTYPNGVHVAPLTAQRRWDRTAEYGGSPNVYYGESAPRCEYVGVGIVVAPLHVAGLDRFTSADWPGVFEAGFTYEWVGRFVHTLIATPGQYTINPSATCSTPRK